MPEQKQSRISNVLNKLNSYEFEDHLLSNKEMVFKYKPMELHQIKNLLLSKTDRQIEGKLDDIIKSNVTIGGDLVNPLDLYIEDRFWILYNMRLKSRGESIDYQYKCGNEECQQITQCKIDLNKLTKKELSPDIEYKIELNDDVSLELDMIRRKDILKLLEINKVPEITGEKKSKKQQSQFDELQRDSEINLSLGLYSALIKKIILSQDSSSPPSNIDDLEMEEKMEFLNNLSELDYNKIKDWYEKNRFGVDLTINLNCPICEHKQEEVLNIGNFF